MMVLVAEAHIDPFVEGKETQKKNKKKHLKTGGWQKKEAQHIYTTAPADWLINCEPPVALPSEEITAVTRRTGKAHILGCVTAPGGILSTGAC